MKDQEFWVCGEYSGQRLSRIWIEGPCSRPDEPEECTGQYPACANADRAPWSHEMAHIPYPFNGMGGEVLAGPFQTEMEARKAEADFGPDD